VFAQFQDYDDEGYLLLTVQQFLRGLPVYDQVYTQYGPAYYLWQQLLHGVLGIPVTHDATRLVTLVIWLLCAALVGTIVRLLTKRPLLGAVATAGAFLHLTQLTYEPGHPQELCMLCILGALTLTTWRLVDTAQLGRGASIGIWALVGVTALTKVNVGAFLAGALILGLVTSLRRSRSRTVLERVLITVSIAAVPVLMRDALRRTDVWAYVIVVVCGVLAVFIARSNDDAEEGVVTAGDLVAGAAAFAIGCGVVIAAIVYEGTSPAALLEALLVAPQQLPKVFWSQLPVSPFVALVAPAAVLAAWWWRGALVAQHRWIEFVLLGCGLIMFVLSSAKSYSTLFAVGPLLAWLVLSDRDVSAQQRAARRILAFAAVFLSLQAYPMPSTQMVLGTVLYVPVALVMIADAQRILGARARSSPAAQPSFRRRALLAGLVVAAAVNLGTQAQGLYARSLPLDLPGTRWVRTTAVNVATFRWLTTNLRANCDGFISAPGLNSLHFWTNISPVSTLNTTLWPLLFDDDQQRRIMMAAERIERLCVV